MKCGWTNKLFKENIDLIITNVIYLLKNSLAVKQGAALFKMASVKKVVKSKGGGQEMAVMV